MKRGAESGVWKMPTERERSPLAAAGRVGERCDRGLLALRSRNGIFQTRAEAFDMLRNLRGGTA